MNKQRAKQIIKAGVTIGQIRDMLVRAREAGEAENESKATLNRTMSRGQAFGIFWNCYGIEDDVAVDPYGRAALPATNALREFGEYWQEPPATGEEGE